MDNVASTFPSARERRSERRYLPLMFFNTSTLLVNMTEPFTHTLVDGDIHDFNNKFIAILNELGRDVQRYGIDMREQKHDYLTQLRRVGSAAYHQLLPSAARNRIEEIRNQNQNRELSITFTAHPHILPFWEMLYEGKPYGEPTPEQFWGFRYPLGRNHISIPTQEEIYIQMGIFSSIHNSLSFSRQEVENLASLLQELCQPFGLNLKLLLLDQKFSSKGLSIDQVIEFFNSDEFCYGIVHFACHSWNRPHTGATHAYLSMTSHETELEIYLDELIAYEDYGFQKSPFVFLNACETATLGHLLQSATLPVTLLKFGAGGVIATACTIPDNFASAFASEFYRRLLNKSSAGVPIHIGEALLETRLHFLHQHNNPLGMAYGLYAASNQKLVLREE